MRPRPRSSIATLIATAVAILAGCRVDPSTGTPFTTDDDVDEPPTVAPPDEPSAERGGAAGTTSSSNGGGNDSPAPGADNGAGGGVSDPPPGACDAQSVVLDELRAGIVLPSVPVVLVATATSQKFLVSQTDAGSCLWGVFVGDSPAAGEPRGVLVISYGDESLGDAPCEPGTDAIPDDIAPGDSVRVIGRSSSFVPSSCDGIVPAPQVIADARCPFERLDRVAEVEPLTLPFDVADDLARGADPELVRRFAGGLVRLENVSALPNESGDGAVRPYGVVALAETELEIHADIEYGDLSAGGPRDATKSLDVPYPAEFRSITGLIYLDYCTYALAPRHRCGDFNPPTSACP
jgi:hypothetical protein